MPICTYVTRTLLNISKSYPAGCGLICPCLNDYLQFLCQFLETERDIINIAQMGHFACIMRKMPIFNHKKIYFPSHFLTLECLFLACRKWIQDQEQLSQIWFFLTETPPCGTTVPARSHFSMLQTMWFIFSWNVYWPHSTYGPWILNQRAAQTLNKLQVGRRRARALPVRRRARAPWCILLLALKGLGGGWAIPLE